MHGAWRPALVISLSLLAASCGEVPTPSQALSKARDITLNPDTTLIRGQVPRNANLASMLTMQGLATDAAARVVAAARRVFDPRRLRSSQPFSLERTLEGTLRLFEYEVDPNWFLRVMPRPGGEVHAELVPIPRTLEAGYAAGTIGGDTPSLFQAMQAAGEGAELTMAMAQVFAGEIDFNNDVQPDDSFAVTFEKWNREGGSSTYGAVTAAEFHNAGRVIRAIRFTVPGSQPDYYDENGRSLQRFFLRSPLKFDPRITSRFSRSRMHPVLQRARAHNGVDYAAPTGAAVVAVSPGTVISATFDNANGRMVRLRHSSGYVSYYLHLSAFGPGIRAGARVAQGETIGRVGMTGLATGPHLHYGLQRNGGWVDPLREQRNMPPGEPVPAASLDAFGLVRDEALAALQQAARLRNRDAGLFQASAGTN